MDQERATFDSSDLEPMGASSSLEDTPVSATSAGPATTDAEAPGIMRLYARAMRQHPVMDRSSERALAVEIEDRSRALWTTLLSDPATAAITAALAAERLPAARLVLRRIGRAAAAATRRDPKS